LLVADFGPTNAFRGGRNNDGIVYRITPDGAMTRHALGIGDPNFILVRSDGSYLVSDDATADIYLVQPDGKVDLYTTAVNHPNGLALSADESVLYVGQIFTNIRPVVPDNAVWSIDLKDGQPVKDAKLAVRAGPGAAIDGLAMDELGRVYIAANNAGELWRFNPLDDEMKLIATGMFGLASLAFGEGEFDPQSIYATATFSGGRGGKIWRIPVGAGGALLHR
jgi:sugar lactone lactonase YvrE